MGVFAACRHAHPKHACGSIWHRPRTPSQPALRLQRSDVLQLQCMGQAAPCQAAQCSLYLAGRETCAGTEAGGSGGERQR